VPERQTATETKPSECYSSIFLGDKVEQDAQIGQPARRRERTGTGPNARERARRDRPARFVRDMFGELWQQGGGLSPEALSTGQAMDEHQCVGRAETTRGQGDTDVQRGLATL